MSGARWDRFWTGPAAFVRSIRLFAGQLHRAPQPGGLTDNLADDLPANLLDYLIAYLINYPIVYPIGDLIGNLIQLAPRRGMPYSRD